MKTALCLAIFTMLGCGGSPGASLDMMPPGDMQPAPGALGGSCDNRICDPPLASATDSAGHCRCIDARFCGVSTWLNTAPPDTHVCCYFDAAATADAAADSAGYCAIGACHAGICTSPPY